MWFLFVYFVSQKCRPLGSCEPTNWCVCEFSHMIVFPFYYFVQISNHNNLLFSYFMRDTCLSCLKALPSQSEHTLMNNIYSRQTLILNGCPSSGTPKAVWAPVKSLTVLVPFFFLILILILILSLSFFFLPHHHRHTHLCVCSLFTNSTLIPWDVAFSVR